MVRPPLRSLRSAVVLAVLLLGSAACASSGERPEPGTDPGKLVIRVDNSDARLGTLSIYLNQPPIRKMYLGTVDAGEVETFIHRRRSSQRHFQLLAEGSRGMRRLRTIDFKSDGESSAHFFLSGPALVEWDLRSDRLVVTYDPDRGG